MFSNLCWKANKIGNLKKKTWKNLDIQHLIVIGVVLKLGLSMQFLESPLPKTGRIFVCIWALGRFTVKLLKLINIRCCALIAHSSNTLETPFLPCQYKCSWNRCIFQEESISFLNINGILVCSHEETNKAAHAICMAPFFYFSPIFIDNALHH